MTGFESKRDAAADKLLEEATRSCNNIDEQRALDALMREAQPAQEPVSFPCCGYTDANAIRWNQFNGVVQCHMCGQVYTVAQPAQESYDQTALELCNVCGWKTLIPDDCCLNCERAQPAQEPLAWKTMEAKYPSLEKLDIRMGDGSILCDVWPQSDGDFWWAGSGTGEKFIDPKYADVTHWRVHSDTTPPQRTEERNFCSRCGKRTADLTVIHTCTPPIAADS